jgi:hypothetical protein
VGPRDDGLRGVAVTKWRSDAKDGVGLLAEHLAVGVRRHFSPDTCSDWVAGTYGARALWTADFGDDQFSLGRAFYTHLEQGRSGDYFADAAASDRRVETHAKGLQAAMRVLASSFVGGDVKQRRGWCGSGIHIFPASGHVATHGGVIHFDTEGLTAHHITNRRRALSLVAMLQPPSRGGGLGLWDVLYDGRDALDDDALEEAPRIVARYGVGDVVVIDSYRLHQIQPFRGNRDRVSATIHLAEIDDGHWESWF